MDPKHVVLDISSDEEVGLDRYRGDDYEWLSDLLREVDKVTDDSDDVVVVREVNPTQKSKFSKSTAKEDDDDDDDCVVLDGDPDNAVPTVNDSENGSDDLLIVGEKGQIACRDYPHSRDQCAKFPFNSTPHEGHCDQCHCYVCDSPAPCGHWGSGKNIFDHCHATNKDESWVNRRKSFRLGKSHLVPVPLTPRSKEFPQVSQNSSFPIWEPPNPILQNQVSRPTSIRACSSQTNVGVPIVPSLINRNQRPGVDLVRNRFQPHLVSQKPPGTHNNFVNRQDRGHGFGTLGPQFPSSRPMFKRTVSSRGALSANRSSYGPYVNPTCTTTVSRNVPQKATPPNDRTSSRWQDYLPTVDLDLDLDLAAANHQATQPNLGSFFSNAVVSSPPQAYSQPILLQSNDCQGTYLHGNQAQNVVNPSFANISGSWSGGTSQSISHPPPIENSQLQSADPTYIPCVMEFNPQFSPSPNPNPEDPLDLFDSWILENQSVQGVSEGSSVPPDGLNLSSSDHSPPTQLDAGMLYFDFETSWNSLTRA